MSDIRFHHFPITHEPPQFVEDVVECFRNNESAISTMHGMGSDSNAVLGIIRTDLEAIGFDVEKSKKRTDKIFRPITFGENGIPQLQYEIARARFRDATGKGGHHRIYVTKLDESGYRRYIVRTLLESVMKDFPKETKEVLKDF